MQPILRQLAPRTRTARILNWSAAFWVMSALAHGVALMATGGSWAGAISFRKPIVFSLSAAALFWAVGWVIDQLPDRPRLAGWITSMLVSSLSVEVALIAVQAWRGRASHFNVAEAGDGLIFTAMGIMIGFTSLAVLAVAVWALWQRPADGATRWAVLGGLGLIISGLGIGPWIIQLGAAYVERVGLVPDTVLAGEAGVPKFPHALAFHGIQVFIVLWALMRVARWNPRQSVATMRSTVYAYVAIVLIAIVRTAQGYSPIDVGLLSWVGIMAAAGLIGTSYVRAVRSAAAASEPPKVRIEATLKA